jgi:hypothetical protein
MSPQGEYSQLSGVLAASLDLQHPPVAISFTDSVPAGVKNHAGRVPAGCRFWQDAARAAFATSASDHSLCAIGVPSVKGLPRRPGPLSPYLQHFLTYSFHSARVSALPGRLKISTECVTGVSVSAGPSPDNPKILPILIAQFIPSSGVSLLLRESLQ